MHCNKLEIQQEDNLFSMEYSIIPFYMDITYFALCYSS